MSGCPEAKVANHHKKGITKRQPRKCEAKD